MRVRTASGPTVDQLPIPKDARPNGYWTRNMMEIEAVIGGYATLLICDAYGGDEVDIPKRVKNAASLVELIGPDAAAAFIDVFGGAPLYIPLAKEAIKWARAAPILAELQSGQISIAAAAQRLRIKRAVLNRYLAGDVPQALRRVPEPDRQFSLFARARP
jgi:hypothetical protein